MSLNKKLLTQYLQVALSNFSEDSSTVNDDEPHQVFGGDGSLILVTDELGRTIRGDVQSGQKTLYLNRIGLQAKANFVKECLKDRNYVELIGEKAIFRHINDWLVQNHGQPELDFKVATDLILKVTNGEVREWTLMMPVWNLQLDSEVTVGQAKFVPTSAVDFNSLLPHRIEPGSFPEQMLHGVQADASAWAFVTIKAHEDRTFDLARARLEESLNAIRAFTSLFVDMKEIQPAPAMLFELADRRYAAIAFSGTQFKMENTGFGFFVPFQLGSERLGHLRQHVHFDVLSTILLNAFESLPSLHNAIRRAVNTLGRSKMMFRFADQFTLCTICLERLLLRSSEKEQLTERFSERLALLLESEAGKRKDLYRFAKELYGVRSEVVHQGFDGVTYKQLRDIQQLAVVTITKALKFAEGSTDHDAFINSILDKRWEGAGPPNLHRDDYQ